VHQQIVLGQEAREEHAVPLRVGGLLDEGNHARSHVVAVAELSRPRAQAVAQAAVVERLGGERVAPVHGEGVEGGARGILGRLARLDDGVLQRLT